jgi:hypothetical protein
VPGDIHNGDVAISAGNQIVDQGGLTAPTSMIEAKRARVTRSIKVREVLRWGLNQLTSVGPWCIDAFPVRLRVHLRHEFTAGQQWGELREFRLL